MEVSNAPYHPMYPIIQNILLLTIARRPCRALTGLWEPDQ